MKTAAVDRRGRRAQRPIKFIATLVAAFFCASGVSAAPVVFNYTGAAQSFVVPEGVFSIEVEAWGAQGFTSYGNAGGLGGYVTGILSVTPGQVLQINVGGAGTEATGANVLMGGGWNGGGDGAKRNGVDDAAGGGGGATDIRVNLFSLVDRLLVAGGGGGATATAGATGGAGGGLSGGFAPGGASGGTQVAGGAGSGAGFYGEGGDAVGFLLDWASGGGGGYFGGGAGLPNFGGGGGSGFAAMGTSSVAFQSGVHFGNGMLVLDFQVPAEVPEPSGLFLASLALIALSAASSRRNRSL